MQIPQCLRWTDWEAGTVTFAYCLRNFALQSRGALEDLLRADFLTDLIVGVRRGQSVAADVLQDLVLAYSDVADSAIAAGVKEHLGALLESASNDGRVVDAATLLVGSSPEVRSLSVFVRIYKLYSPGWAIRCMQVEIARYINRWIDR